MATRTLKVDVSSADDAFDQNPQLEARFILADIRERLLRGSVAGKVRDSNGNTCGSWSLAVQEEAAAAQVDPYLIWSNEHRRWWKPDEHGYGQLGEAGLYSRAEAMRICKGALAGWDGVNPPNEIPVLLADAQAAGLFDRWKEERR